MKIILLILLSFIALTSIISGIFMISCREGGILNLPISLLKDTPFNNFMFPGILLAIIVGGVNLVAIFYNLENHANQYNWAMAGGFIISGWIIAQIILINTVHWLHFIFLGMGILIILLSYQLKGKWAV